MNTIDHEKLSQIDTLKKEIDAFRPLSDHTLKSLKDYFRIGLTYSSNALEGNSLTETETKIIIEDGLTAGGKPLRDHLEVIGHAAAYDFMYEAAKKPKLSLSDILELHKLFYAPIDMGNAGVFRKTGVIVTGTDFAFPKPDKLETLTAQLVNDIHRWEQELHSVECAARAHLGLVTIHPFVDGNGRTARLLMNVLLFRHGYAITIIPPVLRRKYIATLRESNTGKDKHFLEFIANSVYESCKEYLRIVREIE